MTKETIKYIVIWLFIFVIGSLIVTAIVNPEYRESATNYIKDTFSTKGNVGGSSNINPGQIENEDPLVSACKQSYNECRSINKEKYGTDISVLRVNKFSSTDNALSFYDTWKGVGDMYDSSMGADFIFGNPVLGLGFEWNTIDGGNVEDIFPIVLTAIKVNINMEGYGKVSDTIVLGCDSEGKLTSNARKRMLC